MNDYSIPDIRGFDSFPDFLNAVIARKKKKNPRYSNTALANQIGFSSKAYLSHYILGKRIPTKEHIRQLESYFEFEPEQQEYFYDLLEYQDSCTRSPRLSSLLHNKLQRQRPIKRSESLIKSKLAYLHWSFLYMREVMRFFKESQVEKIFHKCHFSQDIQVPLESFDEFTNDDGELLVIEAPEGREEVQGYHKGVLEIASEAIEKIPVDERYFTSVTFTGNKLKFDRLKKFIRELEKESLLCDDVKNEGRVYHCNIQLYPISETFERRSQH